MAHVLSLAPTWPVPPILPVETSMTTILFSHIIVDELVDAPEQGLPVSLATENTSGILLTKQKNVF